jgi:phage-related tail protein
VWPIGLAVGAVVGIIAIFKRLWDTSPKFREWARGIGDSIETFFVKKINGAIDVINALIRGLNKVTNWDVPEVGKKVAPSGTQGMGTFQAMQRYASGTNWAKPGLAWVGEQGPEIVNFRGGEQVFNAAQSLAMAGPQTVVHSGTVTHKVETNDGKVVAQIVEQIRTGNRRLPQGVTALPFGY